MANKNKTNNEANSKHPHTLSEIDDILDQASKKNSPSAAPQTFSEAENLQLISEVFKIIEDETVEIAELLFEILLSASDAEIMNGNIPSHKNKKIAKYIAILNRLFKFSRANPQIGSYRIINRRMIEDLDRKTYTISMCLDGGTSLDILCDVVNVENNARTPTRSPVRVVVKQMINPKENTHDR